MMTQIALGITGELRGAAGELVNGKFVRPWTRALVYVEGQSWLRVGVQRESRV